MKRLALAAMCSLAAMALPAKAEDPRLVTRMYDPAAVVRIEGRTNVQSTIRFGEDELIENVAIGDSQKWQVTPNKRANLLFVKPLDERAATNMTVVTNLRTYLFDLVASPKVATPVYILSFDYPADSKPKAAEAGPALALNSAEVEAATRPQAIVDPAELNFAWDKSGDRKLYPARIYDDGSATFIIWPAGAPVPAILVKDEKGTEGPVNFSVRGDVIVIDGVPKELVLRSGKAMATLENNGPPRPASPQALAQLEEVAR